MNRLKKSKFLIAIKTVPMFFSLLKKYDSKYLYIMILEMIAFSIDRYPALFIMKYTTEVLATNISYRHYLNNIIPLITIMLILKLFRVYVNTNRPIHDQVITEKMFNDFFHQCMKCDFQSLEDKEFQDKKELAKYLTNGKIAAVGWYFVDMFSNLIALVIAAVLLLQISILLWGMVAAGIVVKISITKKTLAKTIPMKDKQVIDNRFIQYLYSIGSDFEYAKEFRVFCYKKHLDKKIEKVKFNLIKLTRNIQNLELVKKLHFNINDFGTKVISFTILGLKCFRSVITIGDFVFGIELVNDFIKYTESMVTSIDKYVNATNYIEYYNQFMSRCSYMKTASQSAGVNKQTDKHIIELRGVSFRYPNSVEYAIKDMNLKIVTPVKISLVGENGAGKTTLIKLLLRLYQPSEGAIFLDGRSIQEYDEKEYMAFISSVFQDFVLFAFTIEENITSFRESDSRYLDYILYHTGVSVIVNKSPDKLGTYITNAYCNEGIDFSGGEQQKIALARSFYKKNADICILDEPTAMYDAKAEYMLYQKYKELLSGKTSIFISHRLSSCKLSDRIMLLESGKIIEDGSHDELIKLDGKYRFMYELQSSNYKEGYNEC